MEQGGQSASQREPSTGYVVVHERIDGHGDTVWSFWLGPPETSLGPLDRAAVFASEGEARQAVNDCVGPILGERMLTILPLDQAAPRWQALVQAGMPIIVVGQFGGGWSSHQGER